MVAIYENSERDAAEGEEEDDFFDYHYSYLYKSEQNLTKTPPRLDTSTHTGDRAPSLSSSVETDSSNEDGQNGEIWKTLSDAKKRQQDIRSRLGKQKDDRKSGAAKFITPRNAKIQSSSSRSTKDDSESDEEEKPDSSQALTPDDVVKMVMRRASVSGATSTSPAATSKKPQSGGSAAQKTVTPRRLSAPEPSKPVSTIQKSQVSHVSSKTRTIGTQTEPVKITPVKGSKLTGLSGIAPRRKSRRRRNSQGSATSAMTAATTFYDAPQDYDDMTSDSDSLSSAHEEEDVDMGYPPLNEQESESEQEEAPVHEEDAVAVHMTKSKSPAMKRLSMLAGKPEVYKDPNLEYLDQKDSMGFQLVKPLPFVAPVFKADEEEAQYDPDEQFEVLYGDRDVDSGFDKEKMDEIYGKFDDDRDPADREREQREKEYEAKKKKLRKEKRKQEREERRRLLKERRQQHDDEEEEPQGIGGFMVSSVVNVGATFGLWNGKEEDDEYFSEEDEESSSDEDSSLGEEDEDEDGAKQGGLFSMASRLAFKPKPAKNPPKQGVALPSRELEIIKKCQDAWKVREKEAAAREARQKELDKENLRMRKEEEEERLRVALEVEEYREEMLAVGKGNKLAKLGKQAAAEYDDRLAMEETMKEQQRKAEEMQENIQSMDDKGKNKKSKKQQNEEDGDSQSTEVSYEKGCCCIVM